jgi:hypothetical protein
MEAGIYLNKQSGLYISAPKSCNPVIRMKLLHTHMNTKLNDEVLLIPYHSETYFTMSCHYSLLTFRKQQMQIWKR